MYTGSCHCGAVRMTLPSKPEVATACNCSLCRRIGGPWVYFAFGTVKIEGHPEATAEYIQGDKTLRTTHCVSASASVRRSEHVEVHRRVIQSPRITRD